MKHVQDYAEVFATRLQADRAHPRFDALVRDLGSSPGDDRGASAEDRAIYRKRIMAAAGFYRVLLLLSGLVAAAVACLTGLAQCAGLFAGQE